MSYCELLAFKKGGYDVVKEFKNAHGWHAFVWTSIFDTYMVKKHKYDSWLQLERARELWKLHNSDRLEDFERFVLRATFDYALVRQEDIGEYMVCLASFYEKHITGRGNHICHIPQIIEDLKDIGDEYEAVGWYGMSVSENPWDESVDMNDDDNDAITGYDISTGNKHFFVDSKIMVENRR